MAEESSLKEERMISWEVTGCREEVRGSMTSLKAGLKLADSRGLERKRELR
jgi:hypothetical protein